MNNATMLKHAMKYLDLSGVELARRLSMYREDGRKTAPETVSRWLKGNVSIDPAVMAWIDQSVRMKAYQQASSQISIPTQAEPTLVIGVANLKSSFATSVLALQMAALAKQNYKAKVTYMLDKGTSYADRISQLASNAWVPTVDIADNDLKEGMLVIKDIPSVSNDLDLGRYENDFFTEMQVDVALIPADFSDMENARIARRLISEASRSDNEKKLLLVHTPECFTLDFVPVCKAYDLDTQASYFCRRVVESSRPHEKQIEFPSNPFTPWESSPEKDRAEVLLSYAVHHAGGHIENSELVRERMESQPLSEILKLLWRDCQY